MGNDVFLYIVFYSSDELAGEDVKISVDLENYYRRLCKESSNCRE